ncbi:MAG: branched-chain amino acid ABC transporter permease [Candidatus Caldarchaeum sp.]|uniref:Branched-chain amino acid ABC transporter permease n=1 Tax=Caldiarchaeum subterraneum TaxID=311458 RepID=A0A7C5Q690_CALS0
MVLPELVDSLLLGSIFAAAGISLSLYYSATGIFNFSHGALIMLGGYLTYSAFTQLGLPLPLAVLVSVVVLGVGNTLFYRCLLHPIRHHHIPSTILTLALLLVLERLASVIYGPWGLPFPTFLPGTIEAGGIPISIQKIGVSVMTLSAIGLLWVVMNKTWTGLGVRATIDNMAAAASSGINPELMMMLGVFLSSVVTALTGVSIASTLFLSPILMSQMNMVAIAVSILAGLGSLWGILPSAFILALSDVFGATYVGGWFRFVNLAVAIIIVLLLRPQGIFGVKERVV